MSDLEKILAAAVDDYASSGHPLFTLLKARLLPLLEAGEAMRKDLLVACPANSILAWDAAKRKGME